MAGRGDFVADADGRLTRGPGLIYGGAQIIATEGLAAIEAEAFSLNLLWDRMLAEGRLFGLIYPGRWCDVGQPGGHRRWPKPCWRAAMFEPQPTPRVFALPPGVDFPRPWSPG